jgi:hypothetical protein
VIGLSDGLTVPFALAAGISGVAWAQTKIVVLAGLAEIAAGSIAMGLGATWQPRPMQSTISQKNNAKIGRSITCPTVKKRKLRMFSGDMG